MVAPAECAELVELELDKNLTIDSARHAPAFRAGAADLIALRIPPGLWVGSLSACRLFVPSFFRSLVVGLLCCFVD